MKDHDRHRDEELKEQELSPAGQIADKNWKRTNWLLRIGVCVVILAVLVVSFGPYCVYRYGQYQLDREMYAEAASTFQWLHARMMFPSHSRVPSARGYRDCDTKILECHYRWGLSLMEEGAYEQAKEQFLLSINYGDSEAWIEECNVAIYGADTWNRIESINAGDVFEFGTYEQDGIASNGKESLQWRVLDERGDRILVISQQILDSKAYHTENTDVTWGDCALRQWLNGEFVESAFTPVEREMIVTEKTLDYFTSDHVNHYVSNQVFLLSYSEAWNHFYFSSQEDRMCKPTNYAIDKGLSVSEEGGWWLLSSGENGSFAPYVVAMDGTIREAGDCLDDVHMGVRPAMWIDLDP